MPVGNALLVPHQVDDRAPDGDRVHLVFFTQQGQCPDPQLEVIQVGQRLRAEPFRIGNADLFGFHTKPGIQGEGNRPVQGNFPACLILDASFYPVLVFIGIDCRDEDRGCRNEDDGEAGQPEQEFDQLLQEVHQSAKSLILILLQLYCERVPVRIRRSMTTGDGFKSVPGGSYE